MRELGGCEHWGCGHEDTCAGCTPIRAQPVMVQIVTCIKFAGKQTIAVKKKNTAEGEINL